MENRNCELSVLVVQIQGEDVTGKHMRRNICRQSTEIVRPVQFRCIDQHKRWAIGNLLDTVANPFGNQVSAWKQIPRPVLSLSWRFSIQHCCNSYQYDRVQYLLEYGVSDQFMPCSTRKLSSVKVFGWPSRWRLPSEDGN